MPARPRARRRAVGPPGAALPDGPEPRRDDDLRLDDEPSPDDEPLRVDDEARLRADRPPHHDRGV